MHSSLLQLIKTINQIFEINPPVPENLQQNQNQQVNNNPKPAEEDKKSIAEERPKVNLQEIRSKVDKTIKDQLHPPKIEDILN